MSDLNVHSTFQILYTVWVKKNRNPRFNFKSQKNENKDHQIYNMEW